jgi:hypothetical protein
VPIYRDDAGCLVLHFGHGDVAVDKCRKADRAFNDEIAFHLGPPGTTTASMGAVVRMAFDNRAAIQVVIEELTTVRDQMPDEPAGVPLRAGEEE